jgi:hypothetical protein
MSTRRKITFITLDPGCPYEWEIFRSDPEELNEPSLKFGRALLLYPGHSKLNDYQVPISKLIFSFTIKRGQTYQIISSK